MKHIVDCESFEIIVYGFQPIGLFAYTYTIGKVMENLKNTMETLVLTFCKWLGTNHNQVSSHSYNSHV